MQNKMQETIGKVAGAIWDTLRAKEEVSVSQLPRLIKEKAEIAYQGLGWLAREEKLVYREKNGQAYVSLNEYERNINATSVAPIPAQTKKGRTKAK